MSTAIQRTQQDLHERMAKQFGLTKTEFMEVVSKTLIPDRKIKGRDGAKDTYAKASEAEVTGFLVVADQYGLNPFIKQIYAFPSDRGGIVPMVPIDGWVKLVNDQKRFAGVSFTDHVEGDKKLYAITCKMEIWNDPRGVNQKLGKRIVEVTEYLAECQRNTEPWQKWPYRMLRHKAYIQCARLAFGLSGIYDEDETERILNRDAIDVTPGPEPQKVLSGAEKKALEEGKTVETTADPQYRPEEARGSRAPTSSTGTGATPEPGETPKTEAEKRAYILEVAGRLSKASGTPIGKVIFELCKFPDSKNAGQFVGREDLALVKAGRWLDSTYGKAKSEDANYKPAPDPEREPGEDEDQDVGAEAV